MVKIRCKNCKRIVESGDNWQSANCKVCNGSFELVIEQKTETDKDKNKPDVIDEDNEDKPKSISEMKSGITLFDKGKFSK